MGLSSLPAPSEGVLCVLLVNTALSLSIFKGLVRIILHIVGIRNRASSSSVPAPLASSLSMASPPPPPPPQSSQPSDYSEGCPPYSYVEEFRSRVPAILFRDAACVDVDGDGEHDCSVCLSQFEPESEINHLACGHVFHKVCLEKWLDYNYWNITCPLCRTPLMPEEEISCFW